MAQLLINSVPAGAEVNIGGEILGTTPLTISIDEAGLEEFRAECLSDGAVACTWDTLKPHLEDQTVSRLWWSLTQDERYSITKKAVINNPYGRAIGLKMYSGEPYCAGHFGDSLPGNCAPAAAIRYTKFGGQAEIIDYVGRPPTNNIDGCYFQLPNSNIVQCLRQPNPYYLPCHFVQCINDAESRCHILSAIQIVNSYDRLANWVVFQYNDFDINPGHVQMLTNSKVVVYTTDKLAKFGIDSRMEAAETLAEFYI